MEILKIAKELAKLPTIRIGDISDLQGNLKDLSKVNYKKLLARLQKVGFKYPLYAWIHEGKYYTLDGKQRHRVIEKEYGADTMLPYIEVKAANKIEAKKEILAISSDYGTVTKEGFDEFSGDFEIGDMEEIEFETNINIIKSRFSKTFKNNDDFNESLIEYPITIITNEMEFKEWQSLKEKYNINDDTKLFFKITQKEYKK
jgi:hypothetical protein